MGETVKVYIYDLSKGMARSMSQAFLGKHIDGIWHTGIVVFGQEFYFGGLGGIESCNPGGLQMLGQPDEIVVVGETEIPFEVFMDHLRELATTTFRGECYHLLDHNCNTFSNELALFLTGNPIPSKITSLPQEVLSTPFGAMIRPMLDSMQVNPGGHQMFPDTSSLPNNTASSSGAAATSQSSVASNANSTIKAKERTVELPAASFWDKSVLNSADTLNLTGSDKKLHEEILEYLTTVDCTWTPGRSHIQLLGRLLYDTSCKDTISAKLLQNMTTRKDIVMQIKMDEESQKVINMLLSNIKSYDACIQQSLLKTLCNLTSNLNFLDSLPQNQSHGKLTLSAVCDICTECLLSDDHISVNSVACALCYNLQQVQLSEDQISSLGMALVQVSTKEVLSNYRKYCLHSLLHCMKENNEVTSLALVMCLDVEHLVHEEPTLLPIRQQIISTINKIKP